MDDNPEADEKAKILRTERDPNEVLKTVEGLYSCCDMSGLIAAFGMECFHILPYWVKRCAKMEDRLSNIIALCWDYDGFDTVESLKSLVDDVVREAKGETTYLVVGKDGVIGCEKSDEVFK